ncbi:BPS1 protein [Nymphaea thermarum]|nr:BPS1 protein [Nymphaea thermarum]
MIVIDKRCNLPLRLAGKLRPETSRLRFASLNFDDSLTLRLKALVSESDAQGITLPWLALAVKTLALTHADARSVIADLKPSDGEAVAGVYLDASIKVLDVCNSVVAEISRRQQRNLLLNYALHLLKGFSGEREKLRRAADSLRDLEDSPREENLGAQTVAILQELTDTIGEAPRVRLAARRKIVLRTIYAVNAVSVLVLGAVSAALFNLPDCAAGVRVRDEFPWAAAYNEFRKKVDEMVCRRPRGKAEEVEPAEAAIATLIIAVDDVAHIGNSMGSDGRVRRLENAITEVEEAADGLSVGLDRVSCEVNDFFSVVLSTRSAFLDLLRSSPITGRPVSDPDLSP